MQSKSFDMLMSLLSAHAQAISALCATHERPDDLRTALATIVEKANLEFAPEETLLYRETLETFREAIPPH